MAREQLGICTEANLHSDYLLFNALEGNELLLRYKLARIPSLIDRLASHFSEALLTSVVAVGSNYWDTLYPDARPLGLAPFPEIDTDVIALAPMPFDLLIQLRSDRCDVNFIASQQVKQLLAGFAELQEHIQGFRYLDGRSLTGFIDMPANPRGKAKRTAALISDQQQPVFAAGSYLYLHCCRIQLPRWQQLDVAEQEEIMGISKVSGQALNTNSELANSHFAVHQQLSDNGIKVLQQNMPFSRGNMHGAMHLTYAATAETLTLQLQHSLGLAAGNQHYDPLFNYLCIDFSAAFFVPSVSFLELTVQQGSSQLTFE